jgi:hypothetical protein
VYEPLWRVKWLSSPNGTSGKEPHRAKVIEAIEDTAHGIISKGMWGEGLTQEEFGVLVSEELF